MTMELQYTISIFQLAFGVNAVFVWLLDHHTVIKNKIVEDFLIKVNAYEPNFLTKENSKFLTTYISKTVRGYKIVKAFFIILFIVALSSCGISIFCLLYAALHPQKKISPGLPVVLSIIFIIVNPILYFVYIKASNKIASVIKDKMELTEGLVELIKLSFSAYEMVDKTDDVLMELELRRYKNKFRKVKSNIYRCVYVFLRPIRFLKKLYSRFVIMKIVKSKSY